MDDADRKAREALGIRRGAPCSCFTRGATPRDCHGVCEDAIDVVATALREAEQRGMMRAAEIALQHAPNPVDSTDRVVVFVLAAVVQAIERAAKED